MNLLDLNKYNQDIMSIPLNLNGDVPVPIAQHLRGFYHIQFGKNYLVKLVLLKMG